MKKGIISIIVLLICIMSVFSQTAKKLVLLEEFTNTSCGPCAKFAPTLDSILMVRLGEVVGVKYHFNYPDPEDQFYLQDKENLSARASYYGVQGVPAVYMDGESGSSSALMINDMVNEKMLEAPTFDFNLTSSIQGKKLTVQVDYEPLAKMDNENLRLFVLAIEEEIILDVPSRNGEYHYINTVRKMLPDSNGMKLESAMEANQKYNKELTWDINGFFNEKELGLVAFIQDISTKKVYATVYAPRSTDKKEAAKVVLVQNTPNKICSPHYTAKIMFRNLGMSNMISAKINVEINGAMQTMDWTGDLAYLETATVTTEDFTGYTLNTDGINFVKITVSDINGTTTTSEPYALSFSNSIKAKGAVQLRLFTDKHPEEITWKLFDSADRVIAEGGPYETPTKMHYFTFPIDVDDCYRLEFYDSGKNGIGSGYYMLFEYEDVNSKGKRLVQDDYDGATHEIHFRMEGVNKEIVAGINASDLQELCTYDPENKQLEVHAQTQVKLILTDAIGKVVLTKSLSKETTIFLDNLMPNIYILQLQQEKDIYTQKIVIK